MDNDFQPLYEENNKNAFSTWEYKPAISDEKEVVDKEIEFAIECERLREESRIKGYEEGLEKANAEVSQLKAELAHWLSLIQNPVQLIDKSLSQEIVTTIMWICEACIGIAIDTQPEKLLSLLETIKKELPTIGEDKQLLMNSEDVEWLKEQLGPRFKDITAILTADTSLARGDFYLKSDHTELDGTLKTRLSNIILSQLSSYAVEENYYDNPLEKPSEGDLPI